MPSDRDMGGGGAPPSGRPLAFRLMDWSLGTCCALLLAGLTGLTMVDVIGRYWFDAPLSGAFELTQLMLCALIFAALPLTTAAGEHIEVDLFYSRMPRPLKRAVLILGAGVSALVLGVIAWRLALHAIRLAHDGAVTNALSVPLSPLAWFAALLAALSAAIALLRMGRGPTV